MSKYSKEDPRDAAAMIDENLKKVYNELASEELPDRFKDLLSKLQSSGGEAEIAE